MLKLVFLNIKDFVRNKTVIFVLFIFTLILISFASLFIMNECTRELLNSTGISSDYYVEFNEPVEFSEIQTALKKSFLDPSYGYYLNTTAAQYNKFKVLSELKNDGRINFSMAVSGDVLTENEPIGIFAEKNNSYYKVSQEEVSSGRYLNKSDNGKDRAFISVSLDQYVESGFITVDNVRYEVVGVCRGGVQLYNNSILVDVETFVNNDNLVSAFVAKYKIPPLKSGISRFEEYFGDNIKNSCSNQMVYFSLSFVVAALKICAFYILILFVLFSGLLGIFYCWLRSGKRNYLIYSFCGMGDVEKKFCMTLEMLIYLTVSNVIGFSVYYVLLNCNYKLYIYYPHPVVVIASVLVTFLICMIMTLVQTRKKYQTAIVHEI